jgi:hypothetical protein
MELLKIGVVAWLHVKWLLDTLYQRVAPLNEALEYSSNQSLPWTEGLHAGAGYILKDSFLQK